MYGKSKPHQSIKGEKEIENIQMRKRIRNLSTEKCVTKKKETVWNRLSKINKISTTENMLAGQSRPNLNNNIPRRFQSTKKPPFKQSIKALRKPLISAYKTSNTRSISPQGIFVKQQNIPYDFGNRIFLNNLSAKKVITARSISANSNSSSESAVDFFKLSNESLCFKNEIEKESSEDSDEVYTLAPLLNSSSEGDTKSCIRTLNKVRQSMELEDIDFVTDAFKPNTRYDNFEENPKVLKDILKAQLQDILLQEFSVKKAVEKLQSSSVSLKKSLEIKSPELRNKIMSSSGHKEIKKFEVDVIFKNMPSLDNEIEILRALGERLETTLKCMTSYRAKVNKTSQMSIAAAAKEMEPPKILKLKYESYDLSADHHPQVYVHLIGIRHCVGIVNEFYVAQRSIVELKRELSRPFYIRSNSESAKLIRTSFQKLKENPHELLRHIQRQSSQVPFNILEQDPIFFYNAFKKLSNIPYLLSTKQDYSEKYQMKITQSSRKSGRDNIFWNRSIQNKNFLVDKKESENANRSTSKFECNNNIPTISQAVVRAKERRRIRRCVTPMKVDYDFRPKNLFFKRILVGIVQMSVFMVLIMALTYPDMRC